MVMLNDKQIRELRMAMGLSVPEFADLLGVSAAAVYKWEKGTRHPDYAMLVELSRFWEQAAERGLFKKLVTA